MFMVVHMVWWQIKNVFYYDRFSFRMALVFILFFQCASVCSIPPAESQVSNQRLKTAAKLYSAALSPDGSVGLLYHHHPNDYDYGPLSYYAYTSSGAVIVDEELVIDYDTLEVANAVLVYDTDSIPHVFYYKSSKVYHCIRNQDGWYSADVLNAFYLYTLLVKIDSDGYFHVLGFDNTWQSDETVVFYAHNRSGVWSGEYVPITVSSNRFLLAADFGIDNQGFAHIIYCVEYLPGAGQPYQGELYYLQNTSGAWSNTKFATAQHASWHARFMEVSVELKNNQKPAAAISLQYNVPTWSDAQSQLYYATLNNGGWSNSILASTSDGYQGTDGNQFTGFNADLQKDAQGKIHIIFSDLASWHINAEKDRAYEIWCIGQVRYINNTSGTWSIPEKLYSQSAANKVGIYNFSHGEQGESPRFLLDPSGLGYDIIVGTRKGDQFQSNPEAHVVRVWKAKPALPAIVFTNPTGDPVTVYQDLFGSNVAMVHVLDDNASGSTANITITSEHDPLGFNLVMTASTRADYSCPFGFNQGISDPPMIAVSYPTTTITATYIDQYNREIKKSITWEVTSVPTISLGCAFLIVLCFSLFLATRHRRALCRYRFLCKEP